MAKNSVVRLMCKMGMKKGDELIINVKFDGKDLSVLSKVHGTPGVLGMLFMEAIDQLVDDIADQDTKEHLLSAFGKALICSKAYMEARKDEDEEDNDGE